MIVCQYYIVSLPLPVSFGCRERWVSGYEPSTLLSFGLYHVDSDIAIRTTSLGPVVLLLSILPLYSFESKWWWW